MRQEIDDPRKWRISMSGFSIKTGWGDEKKVVAKYPGVAHPLDAKQFQEWMDNAERICELHNATLTLSDEDKVEPREIGRIAYEAAAKVAGCEQPWTQANQAKWNAAAKGVLAWACRELDEEAEYGCPCNEDERVAWELTDKLRELGGLPRRPAG